MKKVLITGANGFLGQHLSFFLTDANFDITATGRGHRRMQEGRVAYQSVELTNRKEVEALLQKIGPDVVIHNAALSKPDECENDRNRCIDVNVNATRYLLEATNGHFIYLSTDFVFGENGPHSEDDKPHPLNFYGESKLLAEELIKQSGKYTTIVRPVFMYGKVWEGMKPTFIHWVKNSLEQQKVIKVVSDQWRTPTYVQDICKGIEQIITRQAKGIYNLAGEEILTPYDMAVHVATVLKLDSSLIAKVTADTFSEPVKRASRSGLKIDKAKIELGFNPISFEDGVRRTFDV